MDGNNRGWLRAASVLVCLAAWLWTAAPSAFAASGFAAEITLTDIHGLPIAGAAVAAYAPGDMQPVAAARTGQDGTAVFVGSLLPQHEYYFAASLSDLDNKEKSLGSRPDYAETAGGGNRLSLYFLSMPYTMTDGLYRRTFVIQPGKYVDFFDIGHNRVDFTLTQPRKQVSVHFTALPGSPVIRLYLPMHYAYRAEPVYSQGYGPGELFYATPGMRVMVR